MAVGEPSLEAGALVQSAAHAGFDRIETANGDTRAPTLARGLRALDANVRCDHRARVGRPA